MSNPHPLHGGGLPGIGSFHYDRQAEGSPALPMWNHQGRLALAGHDDLTHMSFSDMVHEATSGSSTRHGDTTTSMTARSDTSAMFFNASGEAMDASGVRNYTNPHSNRIHSPAPSSHPSELISAALAPEPSDPIAEQRNQLKLWSQRIGNQFHLKASQYSDLAAIVDLGENLDTGDLRIRLWQQATMYQILNGVKLVMVENVSYKDAMDAAAAQLAAAYDLNKDQKNQVRILAKDLIIQPGRTNYMSLHQDVESHIVSRAEVLGFKNVFGYPVRETALRKVIKSECSSARNRLRSFLVKSLGGVTSGKKRRPKRSPLESLTHSVLTYFRHGGINSSLKAAESQLHVALLRYHAKDHRYLISPVRPGGVEGSDAEDEDAADEDEDDADADGPVTSAHAPPGRVRKGRDFWSAMDKALEKDVEKHGKDLKDKGWRSFYTSVVIEDQKVYGVNKGKLLPPLPNSYIAAAQIETPALPRLPATPFTFTPPGPSTAGSASGVDSGLASETHASGHSSLPTAPSPFFTTGTSATYEPTHSSRIPVRSGIIQASASSENLLAERF